MTKSSIFYKSEHLIAKYYENNSDILVVSFGGHSGNKHFENEAARDFCNKRGLDLIAVTCSGSDWYQYADLVLLSDAISQLKVGYKRLVCYATSMGAYAAILTSSDIKPDTCIAVAPQATVDPEVTTFETRWQKDAQRIKFIYGVPSFNSSTNYFILFDNKFDLDFEHVKLLRTKYSENVTELKVPFSGHLVGHFDKKFFGNTISSIIYDKFDYSSFRKEYRRVRKNSLSYYEEFSKYTSKDGLKKSLENKAKLLKAGDYIEKSKYHVRQRDYFEALKVMHEIIDLIEFSYKDSCDAYRQISSIYYHLSWFIEAELFIEKAIVVYPENYSNHFLKYLIMRKQDKIEQAILSLDECIRLRPDIEENIQILQNLQDNVRSS